MIKLIYIFTQSLENPQVIKSSEKKILNINSLKKLKKQINQYQMLAIHHSYVFTCLVLLVFETHHALIGFPPTNRIQDKSKSIRVPQPQPGSIINSLTYLSMQRIQNKILISQVQAFKTTNTNGNILDSQGPSIKYIDTDNYNINNKLPTIQDVDIKTYVASQQTTPRQNFQMIELLQQLKEEILNPKFLRSQVQEKIRTLAKVNNTEQNILAESKEPLLTPDPSQIFRPGLLSQPTVGQNNQNKTLVLHRQFFPPFFYFIPLERQSFNFPPIIQKKLIDRQFQNIGFYHKVPTEFVEGQVFLFSGKITNLQVFQSRKSSRVTVILLQRNSSYQIVCTSQNPVDAQNQQFNISCKTDKPGQYYIYAFVVGTQRKFSVVPRRIKSLSSLRGKIYQQPPPNIQPKGLRLEIRNNSLYVLWDSRANITNLTIYQQNDTGIKKREYLLSNSHEYFKVPFADFNDFLANTTTYVQISHALSINGSLNIAFTKFTAKKDSINFTALDHAFDRVSPNIVLNNQIPWRVAVGQKITLNITTKQPLQEIIYIVDPDLFINRKKFFRVNNQSQIARNSIKAGDRIVFQISLTKQGTHILEVNNVKGLAVINRPIYAGQGYPLIPDFRDLQPPSFIQTNQSKIQIFQRYYQRTTQKLNIKQPSKNSSIQQKRQYLLTLINGLRKKYKANPVQLDQSLHLIAQNHSDDMVLSNYVSHINLKNQSSQDRAKMFNFSGWLSQNIAQTQFLIQNHLALERSAAHLQNIVNKFWRRVGIGINTMKGGQYVATYLFAPRDLQKAPLTLQQQQSYKDKLIRMIRSKNTNIIREDKRLSADIKQWMDSDRKQGLFEYIINKRGFKFIDGFGLSIAYVDDWVERLRESNAFDGRNRFRQIGAGIGVKKSQIGSIQAYILFT